MRKMLSMLIILMFILNCQTQSFGSEQNFLDITRKDKRLRSRLSQNYTGHLYQIRNISSEPISLVDISLSENVNSKTAYLSVDRSPLGVSLDALSVGSALALPTLSTSLILSAVSIPFVITANNIGNINAKKESEKYSQELETSILQPNESVRFLTLSKKGDSPIINVTFKTPDNYETIEYK